MTKRIQIQTLLVVVANLVFTLAVHGDLVTFDFEGLNSQKNLTSFTVQEDGLSVDISRFNNVVFDFDDSGAVQFGNSSLSPFTDSGVVGNSFRMVLSAKVNSITIETGDFGGDQDTLNLRAYQTNDFSGSFMQTEVVLPGGGSDFTFDTLSLTAQGTITHFQSFMLFGGNNSAYYDNLVLDRIAVPEPGSAFLLIASVPILVLRRRKKPTSLT